MIAGRDRVAVDVTGIRAIQAQPGNALKSDPWSYRRIRHAIALGLGASADAAIQVVSV